MSPSFARRGVEQAEISGHAGHAEDAEELLGRRTEVGQLLWPFAPAITASSRQPRHVLDEVAGGEAVGLALDDLADRAAFHRLADLERRDVAFHVVHPAAHVGVDRQPAVADPDHAVAERREARSP